MMTNRAKIAVFLCIGALIGFFLLLLVPYLPFTVESPIFKIFGIQKPRIVGFLPYFLSSRATNNYNPYLTTLTYFGLTMDTDGHLVKLTTPAEEDPGWHDLRSQIIQQKFQEAKKNHITLSLSII